MAKATSHLTVVGPNRNIEAEDLLGARVKQVAALLQCLSAALEFLPPREDITHDAVWGIGQLANEARDALDVVNQAVAS